MEKSTEKELQINALKIRLGMIRAFSANGGGHIGGSFDLAEVMAVIYSDFINVKPEETDWEDRDYMIFSKGHAGPALYATLAWKGFFDTARLENLNHVNSMLPGHCDRNKVPGVDATTGSLGQGLSIACGVALAAKAKKSGQKVYCVIGDGEAAEGQIWEAAQSAAHFKLDNLIAILDWNKMQIDGTNDEVMSIGNPVDKFNSFGWHTFRARGNDVLEIQRALSSAVENADGRPSMIVLDTIKGQGAQCIMAMENNHCIGFSPELRCKTLCEMEKIGKELGMEVDF